MPPHCHAARGARPRPACELGDIFRRYGPAYRRAHRLPYAQHKVMNAIERCRTAALGGHREWCARCGYQRYVYHSCRNRHCPTCGGLAKAQWLEQRQAELLPVPYFHNVFTLPHDLNGLILCDEKNRRLILNLLFRAASDTLLEFGRNNLGGTLGVTMVLHTWNQQLRPHFHVHCLIPGGALSADGQRFRRAHPRFLFAVQALSKVFRGKFLDGLQQLYDRGQLQFSASVAHLACPQAFGLLHHSLRSQSWVVYSKPPFASPKKVLDSLGRYAQRPALTNDRLRAAGPETLLDYLGRYYHRVAISNDRLVAGDDGQVRFTYRDRRDGDHLKVATLSGDEFIRRFLYHVLPSGFQRIRHYGLLSSRYKKERLDQCRQLLGAEPPKPPVKRTTAQWIMHLTGIDIDRCPQCGGKPLYRIPLSPLDPTTSLPPHQPPITDTS